MFALTLVLAFGSFALGLVGLKSAARDSVQALALSFSEARREQRLPQRLAFIGLCALLFTLGFL